MLDDQQESAPETEASPEWTPARGLLRAALWGGLTALAIMVPLGAIAWGVPLLALNWWLRMAIGFFTALILFAVVHRAAGMAGAACTALVVALALLAVVSQHVVFAAHGVLSYRLQQFDGPVWFDPSVLLLVNLSAIIGIAFCATLCHGGGSVARTIAEILASQVG